MCAICEREKKKYFVSYFKSPEKCNNVVSGIVANCIAHFVRIFMPMVLGKCSGELWKGPGGWCLWIYEWSGALCVRNIWISISIFIRLNVNDEANILWLHHFHDGFFYSTERAVCGRSKRKGEMHQIQLRWKTNEFARWPKTR